MTLVEQGASLVGRGTSAPHVACAREKGAYAGEYAEACAEASGVAGG